jgi:hypothetical protein
MARESVILARLDLILVLCFFVLLGLGIGWSWHKLDRIQDTATEAKEEVSKLRRDILIIDELRMAVEALDD